MTTRTLRSRATVLPAAGLAAAVLLGALPGLAAPIAAQTIAAHVANAEHAGPVAGDRTIVSREPGGIEGRVVDSAGAPLAGARVGVVGSSQTVFTDARGRFTIPGLTAGVYRVRIVDPTLRALGYEAEAVVQEVLDGATSRLEYRVPSASAALAEMCEARAVRPDAAPGAPAPEEAPPEPLGTGILFGRVQDAASGAPVPGARVRALVHAYDLPAGRTRLVEALSAERPSFDENTFGIESQVDEEGRYLLCGLPEGTAIRLVAVSGEAETDGGTVRIVEPGGVVRHRIDMERRR